MKFKAVEKNVRSAITNRVSDILSKTNAEVRYLRNV